MIDITHDPRILLLTACFERATDINAVYGVIEGGPKSTSDPYYWYFGDFGDDVDKCEQSCEKQPNCYAYA